MTVLERLQNTGIRRRGSKKTGFRYQHASGRAASSAERARIEALRIPPAWREVAVHCSPRAAVQAIGRDAAGRWQYLYHPAYTARRNRRKYARLMAFARSLPQMRRAISGDLKRKGMPRQKVLACALRVLSCCFLRPGSRQYAKENRSFGVATLRRRHVEVEGGRIRLDFPGKSGQRQIRELSDPRVARIVGELLRHPGEVFKFRDEEGHWVDIRRRHLNDYIKEVMGERFSAKDFRTWAGTLLCAAALSQTGVEPDESPAARHRKVVAALRETARHLGNTPAICKASYVYPSVLAGFEKGRIIDRRFETLDELVQPRSSGLHPAEKALLRLLGSNSS